MKKFATRIAPGIIVSTVVEDGQAQTVTFARDDSALGFSTFVAHAPASEAESSHRIQVALERVIELG